MNGRRRLWKVAAAGLAIVASLALVALIVLLLWNALIPEIFGGPTLTYWQTLGLLILVQMLLRGPALSGLWGWRYGRWRRKRGSTAHQEGEAAED